MGDEEMGQGRSASNWDEEGEDEQQEQVMEGCLEAEESGVDEVGWFLSDDDDDEVARTLDSEGAKENPVGSAGEVEQRVEFRSKEETQSENVDQEIKVEIVEVKTEKVGGGNRGKGDDLLPTEIPTCPPILSETGADADTTQCPECGIPYNETDSRKVVEVEYRHAKCRRCFVNWERCGMCVGLVLPLKMKETVQSQMVATVSRAPMSSNLNAEPLHPVVIGSSRN